MFIDEARTIYILHYYFMIILISVYLMTSWPLRILFIIIKKTQIISAEYIQYSSKQSMCLLLLSIHEMCVPLILYKEITIMYIYTIQFIFTAKETLHRINQSLWFSISHPHITIRSNSKTDSSMSRSWYQLVQQVVVLVCDDHLWVTTTICH